MMTSILTAISLALAQPYPNVVSAMEQLQTAIVAEAVTADELIRQLNAISQQVQDSAGSKQKNRIQRGNPFADIQEWHTAMAKLRSAHKQVIYWKRTRAQILETPSSIMEPEPIFIIILITFI